MRIRRQDLVQYALAFGLGYLTCMVLTHCDPCTPMREQHLPIQAARAQSVSMTRNASYTCNEDPSKAAVFDVRQIA